VRDRMSRRRVLAGLSLSIQSRRPAEGGWSTPRKQERESLRRSPQPLDALPEARPAPLARLKSGARWSHERWLLASAASSVTKGYCRRASCEGTRSSRHQSSQARRLRDQTGWTIQRGSAQPGQAWSRIRVRHRDGNRDRERNRIRTRDRPRVPPRTRKRSRSRKLDSMPPASRARDGWRAQVPFAGGGSLLGGSWLGFSAPLSEGLGSGREPSPGSTTLGDSGMIRTSLTSARRKVIRPEG
jgi:hypothetical protein